MKRLLVIVLSLVMVFSAVVITGCGAKETLVGTWKSEDANEVMYVFNEDNTGSISLSGEINMSIKYSVNEDKLTISKEILGTTSDVTYTYSLEKKKLTLTDGDTTLTFVKE